MFQKLVNHNDDIKRLIKKGYAVAFDNAYMVIRDIPYLDSQCHLQQGAIVTKLEFINETRVTQQDHQIFFAGSIPHNLNGKPIPNLGGGPTHLVLSPACNDVIVERSFSNKPKKSGKFVDFFEKIESYVGIISGPAIEIHDATPYTFRAAKEVISDDIFKFHDTLTSRAEITELSEKLHNDVIAIIGLGGTGAYLLDFLVKTPVREIRAFDIKPYHVHNAFRSPGRLDKSELGKSKAEVYKSRYDNFRTGLFFEPKLIDDSCGENLKDVTFAFVCVDKGSSRSEIFDLLISQNIPFIDVGMGLNQKQNALNGLIRATYYPPDQSAAIREKGLSPLSDGPGDIYKANIQISELNAINACLAILKFKQLRGFYFEETPFYHLLFGIGDLKLVGESIINEN